MFEDLKDLSSLDLIKMDEDLNFRSTGIFPYGVTEFNACLLRLKKLFLLKFKRW